VSDHEKHHTLRLRYFLFSNAVACGISFAQHHSILWALWHGFCGWIYIAYWATTKWGG
jgi:hypothetical protein